MAGCADSPTFYQSCSNRVLFTSGAVACIRVEDMDYIREPARDVPVLHDTDVLVAGAGISGLFAALESAAYGARTTVVDEFSSVGGNYGPGLGSRHDLWQSPKQDDRGLGGQVGAFMDALDARGGLKKFDFISGGDNVNWRWDAMDPIPVIDRDEFQRLALQRLRELNVVLLLSTTVAGAIVTDGTVGGVFIETGEGRRAVTAKVVIDTTGEADVAAAAGAETDDRHAREEAGMGLFFRVEGVEWDRYETFRSAERDKPLAADEQRWVDEVLYGALERVWQNYPREVLPFMKADWESGAFKYVASVPGGAHVYKIPFATHDQDVTTIEARWAGGKMSVLNALDRSTIEAAARAHAYDTVDFYRRHVPGCEQIRISQIAPYMGNRYSRTIVPDYTMTKDDIVSERKFDDVVHVLTTLYKYGGGSNGQGKTNLDLKNREEGHRFDIPLGQFLPRGVDGMLAAGRSIGRDRTASLRWRWIAKVTGGVAGLAAAKAAADGVPPRDLEIPSLQRALVKAGYYLGEPDRLADLGLV